MKQDAERHQMHPSPDDITELQNMQQSTWFANKKMKNSVLNARKVKSLSEGGTKNPVRSKTQCKMSKQRTGCRHC